MVISFNRNPNSFIVSPIWLFSYPPLSLSPSLPLSPVYFLSYMNVISSSYPGTPAPWCASCRSSRWGRGRRWCRGTRPGWSTAGGCSRPSLVGDTQLNRSRPPTQRVEFSVYCPQYRRMLESPFPSGWQVSPTCTKSRRFGPKQSPFYPSNHKHCGKNTNLRSELRKSAVNMFQSNIELRKVPS